MMISLSSLIWKFLVSILALACIVDATSNPLLLKKSEELGEWIQTVSKTDPYGQFRLALRASTVFQAFHLAVADYAFEAFAGVFLLPHVQIKICEIMDIECPEDLGDSIIESPIESFLSKFLDNSQVSLDDLIVLEEDIISMHLTTLTYAKERNFQEVIDILDKLFLESAVKLKSSDENFNLSQLYSIFIDKVHSRKKVMDAVFKDPIFVQLSNFFADKNGVKIRLLILLRLLEAFQALIYNFHVTVPAPLFKIRFKDGRIDVSRLSRYMVSRLKEKLKLYNLLRLERELRFIVDAIIKGRCDNSCLLKSGKEIFQNLCNEFLAFHLSDIIKPHQELAPWKGKVGELVPIKKLGNGGFATVYLCRYTPAKNNSTQIPRYVAVKVAEKSKDRALSHNREVKLLIQNNAPVAKKSFLIGCFCSFQTANYAFIAMEYMPGGDLSKAKQNFKGQPEDFEVYIRKLVSQVVIALIDLHSNGIIHKDVKPKNILIDTNGNARLADFGVSQKLSAGKLLYDKWDSTYQYYPPEMRLESDSFYGLEVDWYMLGVTIYELLTGSNFPCNRNAFLSSSIAKMQSGKISADAQLLILSLTEPNIHARLVDETMILAHPWFSGINWNGLRELAAASSQSDHLPDTSALDALSPMKGLGPFEDISSEANQRFIKRDLLYTRYGKLSIFQQ